MRFLALITLLIVVKNCKLTQAVLNKISDSMALHLAIFYNGKFVPELPKLLKIEGNKKKFESISAYIRQIISWHCPS